MGCSISNRVAIAQLPSEELQNNQEAKSQVVTSSQQTLYKTKSDSIAETEAALSQDGAAGPTGTSKDGAKHEDVTSEFPEELPERFPSSQKSSNAQSTDGLLTSTSISKSWPLQEKQRQKSSDILEELRMQGIIKSQRTADRTGEAYKNKRDALEKTLKKPPSRLEKIQFGNKEMGEGQEEELNKMPQHITFSPENAHQTTGKPEKDCPSFESQGTDTLQPLPLDGEPVILLKEVTAVEATSNYTEDSVIKSDNLKLHQ
ncbi:LOW QUALITY PROTEIN: stathmin domain-containing protein 1 [Chlamydotis macqueenii]